MLLKKTRRPAPGLLGWRFGAASLALLILGLALEQTPAVFAFQTQPAKTHEGVVASPPLKPGVGISESPRIQSPITVAQLRPAQAVGRAKPTAVDETVNVQVTLTDSMNRFVTGIGEDSFRIFEEGVEQTITKFSGDEQPATICIVWDSREAGDLSVLERQVSEMKLTYTPSHPEIIQREQQIATLKRQLSTGSANPSVDSLPRISRLDQIFMVVVEGGSMSDALRKARERLARAQTDRKGLVIVADTLPPDTDLQDFPVHTYAHSREELSRAVASMSVELHTSYVLTYVPKEVMRDGTFRHIDVRVTPPRGLPELKLHHSAGYYASK